VSKWANVKKEVRINAKFLAFYLAMWKKIAIFAPQFLHFQRKFSNNQ